MREEAFTKIYLDNSWQSRETKSGVGSEIAETKNVVNKLPELINRFDIKTIFDAGCGDWNWFKEIEIDVNYLGGDIVIPLVDDLKTKYEKENINYLMKLKIYCIIWKQPFLQLVKVNKVLGEL